MRKIIAVFAALLLALSGCGGPEAPPPESPVSPASPASQETLPEVPDPSPADPEEDALVREIILAYGGYQIANLAMGQMTSSLGVPIGVFYIVLPLCGILNMVYTILNIVDILKKKEGTA